MKLGIGRCSAAVAGLIGEEIPVGGNRTYVATKGKADYAVWLTEIKARATARSILPFTTLGRRRPEKR
jgi:hypothetical protein